MILDTRSPFPEEKFNCYFENGSTSPLVISPRDSQINFCSWAQKNQVNIVRAIKEFGAIVFSGFDLHKDNFRDAFTAITGTPPQPYKGDTPRDMVNAEVYKSTAVSNSHHIPLHQEVSAGERADMPKYISFFCVTAPAAGTGQTLVGNARRISEKIQLILPKLWLQMSTKTLTYKARYLPENSWRTKWIKWLNPSHATIRQRFGTENKEAISAQCQREGVTCEWDGDWLVISRKAVPGTIRIDNEILFCNQIHVDRLSPKLCGGWFKYIMARLLLYPTERSLQFDVQYDDGTEISVSDASELLTIIRESEEGRNWKRGDLMILDNATTMHAKTAHIGQREILVAMTGSVTDPHEF